MVWQPEAKAEIEKLVNAHYSNPCSGNCNNCESISKESELDKDVEEKINRLVLACDIYDLIDAVEITILKFEDALEEIDPMYKLQILDVTCEVCNYYLGKHKDCVYETRCKTRFNDMEFESADEMDKFAREEIDFCNNLINHLFLRIDNLPEEIIEDKWIKPRLKGTFYSSWTIYDKHKADRREETLRILEGKYK